MTCQIKCPHNIPTESNTETSKSDFSAAFAMQTTEKFQPMFKTNTENIQYTPAILLQQ